MKNSILSFISPIFIQRPFGMLLVGRNQEIGSGYKYGFNGKEQDDETDGNGNVYDYGFRIYNPRLGKFLSVDPLTKSYPTLTPYQFSSNTPIAASDLDGLEARLEIYKDDQGTTVVKIILDVQIISDVSQTSGESSCSNYSVECLQSVFSAVESDVETAINESGIFEGMRVEFEFGNVEYGDDPNSTDENTFILNFVQIDPESLPSVLPGGSSVELGTELGETKKLGDSQLNWIDVNIGEFDGDLYGLTRTLVHELGHAFGLRHALDEDDPDYSDPKSTFTKDGSPENVMRSTGAGGYGLQLLKEQFDIIINTIGDDTGVDVQAEIEKL